MLFDHVEIMQLRAYHPQLVNCDFCGGEHFNDNCHSYSIKNSWWEQEFHPYNQYEKERLSNLENVLMQFMETSQASFKANQNSIQNLEIQVGKLVKEVAEIPFLVTREENFVEVKAHEESLVEKHDAREKDEEQKEKGEERLREHNNNGRSAHK